MIKAYYKENDTIKEKEILINSSIPENTVWIDVHNPSENEENELKNMLGINIPSLKNICENFVLNRLYEENNTLYMTLAVITKTIHPYPDISTIAFILTHTYLVTIRAILPTSFSNYKKRVVLHPLKSHSGIDILKGLLEEILIRIAHNSELVADDLDTISHEIFGENFTSEKTNKPTKIMKQILSKLGKNADLNSKINASLQSVNHLLVFFKDTNFVTHDFKIHTKHFIEDTKNLITQTTFLGDKLTFLLDASLGMINLQQNTIIKIFSVVAVLLLPPTLVSSIYGMNFINIPELSWEFGYPFAIFIMLAVAILPYLYFRKKNWL